MSDLIRRLTAQGMKELEFGQNMANAAHAQEKRKREAIERSSKYGSNAKNILESLGCEVGRISSEFDVAYVQYTKWATLLGFSEKGIKAQRETAMANFMAVEDYCESPIERKILPWLIFEDYGLKGHVTPVWDWKRKSQPFFADIMIIPQMAILNYRLDFCILKKCRDERIVMVALECDGFGFHNVNNDMQRDGRMAMLGIRTVRASSESIKNCPRDVSRRVAEALLDRGQ